KVRLETELQQMESDAAERPATSGTSTSAPAARSEWLRRRINRLNDDLSTSARYQMDVSRLQFQETRLDERLNSVSAQIYELRSEAEPRRLRMIRADDAAIDPVQDHRMRLALFTALVGAAAP